MTAGAASRRAAADQAAEIGDDRHDIKTGDFIGYRKNGLAHTIYNTGDETFRCLVIGQRLANDVADYPRKGQRIYRNAGLSVDLADIDKLTNPTVGTRK